MKVKNPRLAESVDFTGVYDEASHDGKWYKEDCDQLDDRFDACYHAAQQHSEGVA